MSNWSIIGDMITPQGWQCPVCGAVYSPSTPMCYNCTGKTATYVSSTGKTESSRTESPAVITRKEETYEFTASCEDGSETYRGT